MMGIALEENEVAEMMRVRRWERRKVAKWVQAESAENLGRDFADLCR